MGRKPSHQAWIQDIIKQHPDAPNRTLARLLYEAHPRAFTDLENARSAVRYYVGAKGKKDRKSRNIAAAPPIKTVPVLPVGIKQTLPPMEFMDDAKWLVINDLHCPYHQDRAIEIAVRTGVDEGCDSLCLNGDGIDFYQASAWTRDPRYRSVEGEIEMFRSIMDYLEYWFPGRKVFKEGNHEERIKHYLWKQAPALVGIADFELPKILRLADRGWTWVDGRQFYKLGQLNVFHGHELPKGLTDPVNVGRGVYLRVRETAIVGHWHKTSTHLESAGISKNVTTCYSVGCLCDLVPSYAMVNSWTNGFAIVTVKNGKYHVSNRTIVGDEVYITE